MESNIKSSFIPRDTADVARPRRRGGGSMADLGVLFSIVLLVASVALGVAVFLYVQFLSSSLQSKQDQLSRAQASFEPSLIAELNRLDDRMNVGEDLLAKHIAPSIILSTLEQITLDTVSFTSLQYSAIDKSGITIDLTGVARSVNSIALQADLFGKHGTFVSPIFSNINRTQDGVAFDLNASINPTTLRYSTLIQQPAAAAVNPNAGGQPVGSIPGFTRPPAVQTSPAASQPTQPSAPQQTQSK